MAEKRNKKSPVRVKAVSKARRARVVPGLPPKKEAVLPPSKQWTALLWGGWFLTLFAFFTLANFRRVLPAAFPVHDVSFPLFFLLGLALMIYSLYHLPEPRPSSDLSSFRARVGFFLLLTLGAYLRLHDPWVAVGRICDDNKIIACEVRQIMDFHYYPVLLAYGNREPMYDYIVALLWTLFPAIKGFFIFRLTSSVIDLFTAWFLYLVGKEMGSRRLGLILMAFPMLAKGLIDYTFLSVGVSTLLMGCALTFLFLFRALQRPGFKHFLQLALVVGFSSYTYAPYRLWVTVIVVGMMGWVCLQKEGRPKSRAGWGLALGLAGTWSLLFLCQNSPLGNWVPFLGSLAQGSAKYALFVMVAASYGWVWWKHREEKLVLGWSTAAFLIALANAPLWLNPDFTTHTSLMTVFHPRYNLTPLEAVKVVGGNIAYAFRLLFASCQNMDEQHPPLNFDSFTDFYIPLFGVWGIAALARKFSWPKASVACFFVVGLLPFIMCPGPHTARLLASVVPVFLVAAWGADRAWQSLAQAFPLRGIGLATILFLGIGTWGAVTSYHLSWEWMNLRWSDPLSADVVHDFMEQDRVYLVPMPSVYFIQNPQVILCDGEDVRTADATNPIDLAPGEKGKDIGVITLQGDTATQERLSKEFPGITWSFKEDRNHSPVLKWTIIPFDQLTESPDRFFYIHRVPPSYWTRKFYGDFGLGRGLILGEDRKALWNDELPPCAQGNRTARVEGDWVLPQGGTYDLDLKTDNTTQVFIDGHKVLQVVRLERNHESKATLTLAAGSHHVEEATAFETIVQIPPVLVHSRAGGQTMNLDQLVNAAASPAAMPQATPTPETH